LLEIRQKEALLHKARIMGFALPEDIFAMRTVIGIPILEKRLRIIQEVQRPTVLCWVQSDLAVEAGTERG
jgi:hypothetical protein